MAKYDVILFDADDTLLDFHRAETAALTDTLKEYALPFDEKTVAAYSEINASLWRMLERGEIEKQRLRVRRFEDFCQRFGFSADPVKMAITYTDRLSEKAFVIDGAAEICQKLSRFCRLYLVTNGLKSVQSHRFAASGLSPYFLCSFISEDIGFEKPDVRYFELISARIPGFDKRKTLVVGDSLTSDIQGGINFGLDTCRYNPHGKPTPDNMKITYEIKKLSELENIIL